MTLNRKEPPLVGICSISIPPQMSGKELAEKLTHSWPRLRVLFLSGYTANVIVHHGVLDSGIDFLQKPFRVNELLAKIRGILDRP
jgi:DNA-binding response OmpR family regulator